MSLTEPSVSTSARPWPGLGCGVGLRTEHYDLITREWPAMEWFEAVSENFMDSGGRPLQILEAVRRRYPVALHGVSLSIGSCDPLNQVYLDRLKALVDRIEPAIVSDHLCWTGVDGENLHDLLPLPLTEEAVRHVVERVARVQDCIGHRLLLENVSTYVTYQHSTIPEWEFLTAVAKRSGCGILLDLNNIYVNAFNHQFDASSYLEHIPGELVGQFHLAGHTDMGIYLFDTHSAPVIDEVWALYRDALTRWGPITTLIEWDEQIPEFSRLAEEAQKARAISAQICGPSRTGGREQHPEGPSLAVPRALSAMPVSRAEGPMGQPTLLEVQRWIISNVQSGGSLLPTTPQTPRLHPQGGAPGVERLAVYAGGYRARVHEALAEVYEAVQHVLSPRTFDELSRAYARTYPSHEYNLSMVGRHMPTFLATYPLTQELPFLPDLATLEWLVSRAFHAFEQPSLQPSRLAALSLEEWDRTRLVFQPSIGLVGSTWPILDIWETRTRPVAEVQIDVVNRPQQVLVFRHGAHVRCELVDAWQRLMLEGLLAGRTLGAVCREAAERASKETLPIHEWFTRWTQAGWIIRCERP